MRESPSVFGVFVSSSGERPILASLIPGGPEALEILPRSSVLSLSESSLKDLGGGALMRPEIRRISDNLVFIMPGFIHEYGDSAHHWSMMRTVELDEDEDFIRGTGPSDLRFWLHELLDDYFFYPAQRWLLDWMGDSKIERFFRRVLGFFWGLNCGFPLRDVALYTVWSLRGCKPLAVFRKRGETWMKTYPGKKEGRSIN